MSKVRAHISISLDGYVAGPNQSMEEPLGVGGEELHDWVVALKQWREPHGMDGSADDAVGGLRLIADRFAVALALNRAIRGQSYI